MLVHIKVWAKTITLHVHKRRRRKKKTTTKKKGEGLVRVKIQINYSIIKAEYFNTIVIQLQSVKLQRYMIIIIQHFKCCCGF